MKSAGITQRRLVDDDVDAVAQVGTNLSMVMLVAAATLWLGKPVIAINTATWWHALRSHGSRTASRASVGCSTGSDGRATGHQPVGYAILVLVALRVIWGFIGSQHARFVDFVRPPSATFAYARDLVLSRAPRYVGHNPLAAIMILALLFLLTATCVSGWLLTLKAYRSVNWLEELHESLASLTLALVGLHVLAVVIMSYVHGENLVRSMINGRKRT